MTKTLLILHILLSFPSSLIIAFFLIKEKKVLDKAILWVAMIATWSGLIICIVEYARLS